MRRWLFVVVVFCFAGIVPHVGWSNGEAPEGILDPLCTPCKALCEKTILTMTTKEGMTCLGFSATFSAVCDGLSGGNAAGMALCTTGGVALQGVCVEKYKTPQNVKDNAHEASKDVCKKIKLCK